MRAIFLPILILLLIPFIGYSDDPERTSEQKELATVVGIVLGGMTKKEVLKALGYPKKKGKCISTDQEVWYYKYPEEQIIYFSEDVVDRVHYLPEKEKIEIKNVEWL